MISRVVLVAVVAVVLCSCSEDSKPVERHQVSVAALMPDSVEAGCVFEVQFEMVNAGQLVVVLDKWDAGGDNIQLLYRKLGCDDNGRASKWTQMEFERMSSDVARIEMSVHPGQSVHVSGKFIAPRDPGSYEVVSRVNGSAFSGSPVYVIKVLERGPGIEPARGVKW